MHASKRLGNKSPRRQHRVHNYLLKMSNMKEEIGKSWREALIGERAGQFRRGRM